jgi:hypothetical protein
MKQSPPLKLGCIIDGKYQTREARLLILFDPKELGAWVATDPVVLKTWQSPDFTTQ